MLEPPDDTERADPPNKHPVGDFTPSNSRTTFFAPPHSPGPHAHQALTDRQTALTRDGSNQVSHLAPWA